MTSKNEEEMAALKAELEGQYIYIYILVVFSLLDACWHHVHLCVCVCVCAHACMHLAWSSMYIYMYIYIANSYLYMITEIKDKIIEMIRRLEQ